MTKLPNFSGKAFLDGRNYGSSYAITLQADGCNLVATELTSIHSIIALSAKKRLQEFLQFSDEELSNIFPYKIDDLADRCTSKAKRHSSSAQKIHSKRLKSMHGMHFFLDTKKLLRRKHMKRYLNVWQ